MASIDLLSLNDEKDKPQLRKASRHLEDSIQQMSLPYPIRSKFEKGRQSSSSGNPPYGGTIFVSGDIIDSDDPSAYISTNYKTQESRTMFDRRTNNWETVNAYVFDVTLEDCCGPVEFQVNPEFSKSQARQFVELYGPRIGQLGYALRRSLRTVSLQGGNEAWGGGNNDILIHVANDYGDINEETIVHEACHTSLDYIYNDGVHGNDWDNAVQADGAFISDYAEDWPRREDIAESFLLYQAVRYRPSSLTNSDYQTITNTMPNRIQFFDSLKLNMYPVVDEDDDVQHQSLSDSGECGVCNNNDWCRGSNIWSYLEYLK
jgi:hypothetical protein